MGTDAPASPDVHARDDASRHHELAREVASEAGSRLRQVVEDFRDVLVELLKADLAKPDVVVQFGLPPYRIDILTSVSGVTFEEAWEELAEVDDVARDRVGFACDGDFE